MATYHPHILIFPFPAQGHMFPLIDLTHQLALHNLSITIIITPKNLPILSKLLSLHPNSIQTKIFPFPDHPSIPPGVENIKDIGNQGNCLMVAALSRLKKPIIQWFKSHHNPPVALISDFFLGWTQDLADQISIPRIAFYSSGALLASVYHHIWRNVEAVKKLTVVDFDDLPRFPRFLKKDLPSLFLRYKESEPDWQIVKNGIVANYSSWGSVFNTIDGLEGDYVDYMKKIMGHDRVFAVGPLNLIGMPEKIPEEYKNLLTTNLNTMQWLDECPDDSVLYVCFGSQNILNQDQIKVLATGLEMSGLRFLWAVKTLTDELIDDGFEQRVSDRGLVVKGWAQQTSILGHKAVGGFLSHCGWNSILEAIAAGVMILGWPMEAEQFLNIKIIVEYLEVGVRVAEGGDTVPEWLSLVRVIREYMEKDNMQKFNTKVLQKRALEAIKIGGSSLRDINGLVNQLAKL